MVYLPALRNVIARRGSLNSPFFNPLAVLFAPPLTGIDPSASCVLRVQACFQRSLIKPPTPSSQDLTDGSRGLWLPLLLVCPVRRGIEQYLCQNARERSLLNIACFKAGIFFSFFSASAPEPPPVLSARSLQCLPH